MPPEADVSVIVPAYNAADTIGRALSSIAGQTLKPREVIVVDDGSTDQTMAAAQALGGNMNGVPLHVFAQPNRGAGAARNRALRQARGRYVAFLDADDEWLPEKLERSMAHMADPDMVLVAHDGWIAAGGTRTLNACARRFREGADPFVTLYRKGYIDTCAVVARRDRVLAAGGFDESLANAQDFELWLALLNAPGTLFLVFEEPLVLYHVQEGSIMSHTWRRLGCCLEIARRHAPALANHPGSPLASLLYRVLAVHFEAVAAYRSRRLWGRALAAAAALPFNLLAASAAVARPGTISFFLSLWVVAGMAAYLFQFRSFAGPIFGLLGIS